MKPGRRRIYEDQAKVLYEGTDPNTLVQYFKDQTPASVVGQEALQVEGKGILSNRISACLMEHLNATGVPTHFIRRLNMREQLVRNSERLPFGLRIHNYATAGFAETFGLESDTALPRAIVEYYLRPTSDTNRTAKAGTDSALISDEHITAFNWATTWEMDEIFHLALRINDFLSGFCLGTGLRLSRVDLSFGRVWEEDHTAIVLVDEITPDSCHLWDLRTNRSLVPEGTELAEPIGGTAGTTGTMGTTGSLSTRVRPHVSTKGDGKVVELKREAKVSHIHQAAQNRTSNDNEATSTRQTTEASEARAVNRARLYQHLYREVAQRFGVLTDAETLARDDSELLFPVQTEETQQGENPQDKEQESGTGDTGGVVLPMRRDPRRLSPRLRRSRKADDSPDGEPS